MPKIEKMSEVLTKIATHEKTPVVLTVVSCLGVVATGIFAAKAGAKSAKILEAKRAEANDEKIPGKEIVKSTWKVWTPVILIGGATIATIVTNDRLNAHNAAVLSATAVLAGNALKDYQEHVLEEIGAERDSKVRDRIAKSKVKHEVPALPADEDIIILGGQGDTVFMDALTGRFFKSDMETVRSVENDLNHSMFVDMYVSLNEMYEALGLAPVKLGEHLGFDIDNLIDFHFSAQMVDRKPVVVIQQINMPTLDYNKGRV